MFNRVQARLDAVKHAIRALEEWETARAMPSQIHLPMETPALDGGARIHSRVLRGCLYELEIEEARARPGKQVQQRLIASWDKLPEEEKEIVRKWDEELRETRARLIAEEWRQ